MGQKEVAWYVVEGGERPDFETVPVEFIAGAALFSRACGLRAAPAELVAFLASKEVGLFSATFAVTVDDADMMVRFVRAIDTGEFGRKSLGSAPKRAVQTWLNTAPPSMLLSAVGVAGGSVAEVIRKAHPKPVDAKRAGLFKQVIETGPTRPFAPGPVLHPGGNVSRWVAAIEAAQGKHV